MTNPSNNPLVNLSPKNRFESEYSDFAKTKNRHIKLERILVNLDKSMFFSRLNIQNMKDLCYEFTGSLSYSHENSKPSMPGLR